MRLVTLLVKDLKNPLHNIYVQQCLYDVCELLRRPRTKSRSRRTGINASYEDRTQHTYIYSDDDFRFRRLMDEIKKGTL